MDTQRRSNLVVGLLLVIIGGLFLASRFFPQLGQFFTLDFDWPLYVIGVGLIFFVLSALAGAPGLAIPGSIIAGIGSILYYQNTSGDFASWAYAWTLIPGFVGIGTIFTNLFEGNFLPGLREGLRLIGLSLLMFAIFGAFLGGPALLGDYWPVLLILAGVWMVVRGLLRPGRGPRVEVIQPKPDADDEAEEIVS
ncbi:MAG: hypothetical protein DWG76_02970 [Chloroflexi bacterium]|nr:hypothetical protein [Chloroflexota bacterium]MQC26396.1 hypothetical protein [Chloroflexota bacterium]